MGKIILITGGARSGKSTYALLRAKGRKGRTAFIATSEPKDAEMKQRIALHRTQRPRSWKTIEEPCALADCLQKIAPSAKTVIIDCLTLWVTNLMMKKKKAAVIEKETLDLLAALKKTPACVLLITNEVGLGIVPANKLAREFRDIAGRVNQMIAQNADEVHFMVSGIPWRIR